MTRATTLLLLFLAVIAMSLGAGCSSRGMINADAVETSVMVVSARHDAYVTADPNLSTEDKADFLRSTELLRKVIEAAKASSASPVPGKPTSAMERPSLSSVSGHHPTSITSPDLSRDLSVDAWPRYSMSATVPRTRISWGGRTSTLSSPASS